MSSTTHAYAEQGHVSSERMCTCLHRWKMPCRAAPSVIPGRAFLEIKPGLSLSRHTARRSLLVTSSLSPPQCRFSWRQSFVTQPGDQRESDHVSSWVSVQLGVLSLAEFDELSKGSLSARETRHSEPSQQPAEEKPVQLIKCGHLHTSMQRVNDTALTELLTGIEYPEDTAEIARRPLAKKC